MTPSRSFQPKAEVQRLRFGDILFDPATGLVITAGGSHALDPLAAEVLLALATRPGLTLSWDYLVETVRSAGGPIGGVHQAVVELRRLLSDDARAPRFIETVPGIGYRWIFAAPRRGGDEPGSLLRQAAAYLGF